MLDLRNIFNLSDYSCKTVQNLKGGNGTCEVYTKVIPTVPYYEEGIIIMMETNEVYPSIGMHEHEDDEETYTVITGFFEINGTILGPGESATCKKSQSHNAQLISQHGAIYFQKKHPSAT